MATTACNDGSVDVNWKSAMNPDHPFIAFLIARETDGRMTQISDRSYVKHGFFALSNSQCTPCQNPSDGTFLGVGCSDTYSTNHNGENYWLGPPQEIDPWLGAWDPVCSHFDMGEPPVAPPKDCDGKRSLTEGMADALGPVGHRVQVPDSDLLTEGTFWYQGQYVVAGERTNLRDDNLGSRGFIPSWSGSKWNTPSSAALLEGSVLRRWQGALVREGSNGAHDGRFFYVGVVVTGPVDGMYHYEFAVHNQDNSRAGDELRIPVCPDARVENAGFSDIDDTVTNGWTFVREPNAIRFVAPQGNALEWNSIFNFWFDSDAAPGAATVQIHQALAGAGADFVDVLDVSAPIKLSNVYLGDGCSNQTPPLLHANGAATLGNAGFELTSGDNVPGAIALLAAGAVDGVIPLGNGCSAYMAGNPLTDIVTFSPRVVDVAGDAVWALPIPNDAAFEGLHLNFQTVTTAASGPVFGSADASNGLRVRMGDAISSCP